MLVGGGIVNTYLLAKGYGVGSSLVDEDMQEEAIRYCEHEKIVFPVNKWTAKKEKTLEYSKD